MKKNLLVSVISIISFVGLVTGYIYMVHLMPLKQENERLILEATKIVSEFQECLFGPDIDKCQQYLDSTVAQEISAPGFYRFREQFVNKMGKRLSAEAVKESASLFKLAGIQGSSTNFTLFFNAIYENDPFAKESYSFVSGPDGKLLISKFRVNSVRLQK